MHFGKVVTRLPRLFNKPIWVGSILCLLATGPSPAFAAAIQIITTTSDLKSLTEAVGGTHVAVTSLATPGTNAETFQPHPQDLQKLQAAAMVVRVGLDYDLWLDGLLKRTGRTELMRRGKAHVDASYGIALLEIRSASLDANSGHGHGGGNPHYWLDPGNAEIISANILDGLRRIDPDNAPTYAANRERFVGLLRAQQQVWKTRLAAFAGKPVLAYHDSWAYFARSFRLHIVDLIEPKPGIPPSPARLAGLIKKMQDERVLAIIKQPFDPDAMPGLLAQKTGAKIVVLASSVGSLPQAGDYFSMMDFNVATLAAAYAPGP
ncbi:MAG: metal ABC transporter substrate-binding protein [Sulfuricaulis sp.]|nr:metal ABC transporter substrate-binding protein [Sulfuricaulis sp.]